MPGGSTCGRGVGPHSLPMQSFLFRCCRCKRSSFSYGRSEVPRAALIGCYALTIESILFNYLFFGVFTTAILNAWHSPILPGHKPAIFHRSCPGSMLAATVPVTKRFLKRECYGARLLYRLFVPSAAAAEELSLKMNGPQKE